MRNQPKCLLVTYIPRGEFSTYGSDGDKSQPSLAKDFTTKQEKPNRYFIYSWSKPELQKASSMSSVELDFFIFSAKFLQFSAKFFIFECAD